MSKLSVSTLRIGTRGSALALVQAERVAQLVRNRFPDVNTEICVIHTQGDRDKSTSLSELGGKGVFIRDIEHALLDNRIDLAVHSFKDITTHLADGLVLVGALAPESVADAFISREYPSLASLPAGARVGTGSLRRKALLKALYPHVEVVAIRGNVGTRLSKIGEVCDGVILSHVGLIRLGIEGFCVEPLSLTSFIPAPGQGVIALEARAGDSEAEAIAEMISDPEQWSLTQMELVFLKEVGFDCTVPLGLYSRREADDYVFDAFWSTPLCDRFFYESLRTARTSGQQALSDNVRSNARSGNVCLDSVRSDSVQSDNVLSDGALSDIALFSGRIKSSLDSLE